MIMMMIYCFVLYLNVQDHFHRLFHSHHRFLLHCQQLHYYLYVYEYHQHDYDHFQRLYFLHDLFVFYEPCFLIHLMLNTND
ncbi:unnamed protein product [Schistosoma curassoni]|uniref:Secreted protein n=1 Tax=Schistosoma curassoni TaxID=6186 RepID=A0A183K510_9TREM|nr:unnamed protein product [Schistosoma curassoni]